VTEPAGAPDLAEVARFLHAVFGVPRFQNPAYLAWFYRENPEGKAVEVVRRDASGVLGHVAGIHQTYHSTTTTLNAVFPQNLAVAQSARGKGLMMRMNEACFTEWRKLRGDGIAVGMPNAASTPGYTALLGFRAVGPLPVLICPPVWPHLGRVKSTVATPAWRSGPEFRAFAGTLDYEPTPRLSQRYSPELLQWRLGAPDARYTVHEGRDAAIVSTVSRVRGVPVAVIVKTFRRRSASAKRTPVNGLIAAACRHHLAPGAIYAGFSAVCDVKGVPLPERFKPAPLNLVVRSARRGFIDAGALEFDSFEFFNFDAF
jgi:predicted N-acetyltransferase YhbS